MASVAIVYAKALFLEARASGSLEQVAKDVQEFHDLVRGNIELQRIFGSLLFDGDLRQTLAEELSDKCKFSPLAKRFITLLARKNRSQDLDAILAAFHRLCDEDAGMLRGELWSAVDMPAGELEEIASSIGKRLGRRVQLTEQHDESLLGGFVARVGGKTFDSSLKTQLRSLKEACTAEF